jgi:hypothetical protein
LNLNYNIHLHQQTQAMKKLLSSLALLVLVSTSAFSQQFKAVAPFLSETTGKDLDTLVNATTKNQKVKITVSASTLYIQATATKISGTTAGVVRLFGSNDGVAWKRVIVGGSLAAVDSLNLANVATPQTIFFSDAPSKYLFYRVAVTGAGTASTQLMAIAVADQK